MDFTMDKKIFCLGSCFGKERTIFDNTSKFNVIEKNIGSFADLMTETSDLFKNDLIILDVNLLYEQKNICMLDAIHFLNTLMNVSNNDYQCRLAIGVQKDTDTSRIQELLHTDICGIFSIDDSDEEKLTFLSKATSKEFYITKEVKKIIDSPVNEDESSIKLTPRQKQILMLIRTRGASNKSIAKTLKISESTVKLHLSAIFKKYGVRNRTQLALFSGNTK